MYCIACGVQIPENSKFCSNCGHKQFEGEPSLKKKNDEVFIEKEKTKQVVVAHKSLIDFKFLKKALGWYLAWLLIHFTLLLVFSNGPFNSFFSSNGLDDFWPFGGLSKYFWGEKFACYYDITEFMVYSITPLVIFVIIGLIRNQNKTAQPIKTEE